MTDRKPHSDQNETPEDVATLYSWANLHGAKYRDFSASRAQTREKARQRVEELMEEEQRRARELAEAREAAESQRSLEIRRSAEAAQQAEQASQLAVREAEKQAQQATRQRELAQLQAAERAAAQEAADRAAERGAQRAAERSSYPPAEPRGRQLPRDFDSPSVPSAGSVTSSRFPSLQQPNQDAPYGVQQTNRSMSVRPQNPQPPASPSEENFSSQPRNPWVQPEMHEPTGRPAWLTTDPTHHPAQPPAQTPSHNVTQSAFQSGSVPVAPAPEDTLQGSRDRMTSRWFALRSVFEPGPVVQEAVPAPAPMRAPVIAVFSLAGGVGKTSMVATLGRALSARGERVLLVDTAAFGLLPFFFGARDQRPGMLRTFNPPGVSSDAPIQMITLDPESLGPESGGPDVLSSEISKYSRGASRIILDLATASGATIRRALRMQPMILVPVMPDMNSVVSVNSIDAFFQHNGSAPGRAVLPYYVLNQFDPSLPLNLDVREVLREQLGDRLLPFAIRRAPTLSEALAEGMTVMDYAPNSTLAEDFGALAGWIKGISAAANTTYRGVRWSER